MGNKPPYLNADYAGVFKALKELDALKSSLVFLGDQNLIAYEKKIQTIALSKSYEIQI